MVSNRCKIAVKDVLNKLGLHFIVVDLGEVEIMEELSVVEESHLKTELLKSGLELMDNKKAAVIKKIKTAVSEMVKHSDEYLKINFSDYLSQKLDQDYSLLANLFSEVQGITIEQYIIGYKIEQIKEMLIYGELNLTEIAWKLNYSSLSHLSNQFKKVTGLSPSHFKQLKAERNNFVKDLEMPFDASILA